ncbi:MAG: A/G-specific adenine glycosylase [Desulfobacterales bacterium]|jgi:A/G-specific adenine glycosylase|nr:A/G-specific adenine glycosylase [Desulfobacterales bacterium]
MHITKKTVTLIQQRLTRWYQEHKRPLPWRETRNPYCIWVSEVMLQQTQVKTVIPYYVTFISRFPDVASLAEADLHEVLKLWEGLGYYARARNLHRAAKIVAESHKGIVPDDYAAFRALPGVGEYIAAAVLSIAFSQPHAVVDGNVKRVLARLACIETPVNQAAGHREFNAYAQTLLDRQSPETFNQAMMELGALICKPEIPDCLQCPLNADCLSCRKKVVARYPRRIKARRTPTHSIAVAVIWRNGKVLITQRAPDGLLGGLWEFPGGKVKAKETSIEACKREVKEETGLSIEVMAPLTRVKHAYTHFKIEMDVFICRYAGGRVRLSGPVAFRWVTLGELNQYPFPKANHKFFPLLRAWGKPGDKNNSA